MGGAVCEHVWTIPTAPGRPLAALNRRGPEPIDFWWTIVVGALVSVWLVRGQLSATRASRLLFLILITWLLRQTDFIENPFKPIFGVVGLSGMAFLAFGIVWDALTKGAGRTSRHPACRGSRGSSSTWATSC